MNIKRLFLRLVIALLTLCAAAAATIYIVLSNSLPSLDGEFNASGVQAEVTIERDLQGIPTITAKSRNDVAFATGYVHGQDRYFQMDLMRRSAAGELAELFGEIALPLDKVNRFHRFRSRAKDVVAGMSLDERDLMHAYVNGVNEALDGLAAKPFEYYILGSEPREWNIEDSVLAIYAMFMDLNDERADGDVKRGLVHRELPGDVYDWMYPDGSELDAPIAGEPRVTAAIPPETSIDLRATTVADTDVAAGEDGDAVVVGSNNWAVGGKLTASGRAIVANDMHLRITTPNIFYRARLIVSGDNETDVSGVTLPGTPVVVSGSNGKIAWGFTNSYGDWSDAILVRPGAEPGTYLTADGTQRFSEYRELIKIKGGSSEELLIRETIWGPVLDDIRYPDAEIAVSWIAHHPRAVNVNQLQLERATSVIEALSVAKQLGIPPQNFVSGDSSGNIGWTIAGQIPTRSGADARVPADWSDGSGWSGWLSSEDYPQVFNPPSGRIWTANSRVVDGEALSKIGDGGYDLGARASQIRNGLFEKNRFVETDMLAIQIDDRALFLARWRDLLLRVLDDEAISERPGRAKYRVLVENWIPRASGDSAGYRLVRAFRLETRAKVFDMLTASVRDAHGKDIELQISKQFEGPLWQLIHEEPAHMLASNYESWRGLLLSAVDQNLDYFAANWADDLENRTWSERNTAAIRHPLSRALPLLSNWLDMPREPLSGDSNMPKAMSPTTGASERYGVSPGDEKNGYLHMPTGQSGHPLSDFYRVGHDDWVRGRPSSFLPGATKHRLVISPDAG